MPSSEVSYRRWVLLIACIGSMMAPLDSTIVSVSLPQIAQDLGMSYAEIIWVPTAYLVVLAVMILVMGRVSDLYGRKPIFIAGFGIFALGSLLCSVSTSGNELILFRAIQGFGAACFGATSTAIVTETFPSSQRGKALGINAMAIYVGLSLGPPLGGLLTHEFGWRSIFWATVPLGVLVMGLAYFKLRAVRPESKRIRFDFPGLVLFSITLVSLLVALTLGEHYHPVPFCDVRHRVRPIRLCGAWQGRICIAGPKAVHTEPTFCCREHLRLPQLYLVLRRNLHHLILSAKGAWHVRPGRWVGAAHHARDHGPHLPNRW